VAIQQNENSYFIFVLLEPNQALGLGSVAKRHAYRDVFSIWKYPVL
jgi:hypothetical protein